MSARYTTHDLSAFFDQGLQKGATHMFIIHQLTGVSAHGRNERNDCHYYVLEGEEVRQKIRETLMTIQGYKELLEVYNLKMPKEPQLAEMFACNL